MKNRMGSFEPGLLGELRRRLGVPFTRKTGESSLPPAGFPPAGIPTPELDRLSDADVAELNAMLPWNCFTVDSRGRRIGDRAWKGKRDVPQPIPDPRITRLDALVPLSERHVLEVGCFEGVHTTALCRLAKSVSGLDSRIENVVKAQVRCGLYGTRPRIFLYDLETRPLDSEILRCDVLFHCGVLYHLSDPVSHLTEMAPLTRDAILLDTHYTKPEDATDSYVVGGKSYRYRRYGEHGKHNVFAGMVDHAKWLTLDTLLELLSSLGFSDRLDVKPREERNGPRALIIAARPGIARPE